LLAHIRSLREQGMDARFSVGVAITEQVREAIVKVRQWIPAIGADGGLRDGAQIAEITGLVPDDGYPAGTRFIVRREIPHPGAQLSLFDTIEGFRHQVLATDTPAGQGSISTWRHATVPTPASKTASDAARTPASAGSRLACSPSTPPGSSSR
jgi:hypothetical protein